MDSKELRALLDAVEDARSRADAAMRLTLGAGSRFEAEYAAREARAHLRGLRAILERAEQEERVRRRDLLKALPLIAVSPVALERIGGAHIVDFGLVTAYDEVLSAATRAWPTANVPRLHAILGPHVSRMAERLHAQMPESVRLRLTALTGETAVLAGWSAMCSGQHTFAREHFALAERTAAAMDDPALRALALEGRSNLLSQAVADGTGGSRPALDALTEAVEMMPRVMPGVARQWVLARYAQELAASGDPGYKRRLEAAHQTDLDVEAGGIYSRDFWYSDELADIEAFALTVTGQPAQAQQVLNAELATVPSNLPRRRAKLLAHVASAHVAAGEPEQAARVAFEALDLVEGTGSTRTIQRGRNLYGRMALWSGVPAVRELGERLVATR